jgi:tRNA nucleotidyltransferase (CCA-adding enzyme)
MSRDWESVFTTWAKGPSDTEKTKTENAERQIRQAISANPKLQNRNIVVFTQGSYRNRVNVRKESDVDIGI